MFRHDWWFARITSADKPRNCKDRVTFTKVKYFWPEISLTDLDFLSGFKVLTVSGVAVFLIVKNAWIEVSADESIYCKS